MHLFPRPSHLRSTSRPHLQTEAFLTSILDGHSGWLEEADQACVHFVPSLCLAPGHSLRFDGLIELSQEVERPCLAFP